VIADGERDVRLGLLRLLELRLPRWEPTDAPDVILDLYGIDASTEHMHADIVAIDENVQATVVLLFARERGCNMRTAAMANFAAQRRCY
jgi:hypothetical protein